MGAPTEGQKRNKVYGFARGVKEMMAELMEKPVPSDTQLRNKVNNLSTDDIDEIIDTVDETQLDAI